MRIIGSNGFRGTAILMCMTREADVGEEKDSYIGWYLWCWQTSAEGKGHKNRGGERHEGAGESRGMEESHYIDVKGEDGNIIQR